MLKKFCSLAFTALLVVLVNTAFAETEIVDFGTITTTSIVDISEKNVKMLESGGEKIYQLKVKGKEFSRGELVDAHDQAARKMRTSQNYFRLWFYTDSDTLQTNYYVGKADLVINNAQDFKNFLNTYKGKSLSHFELKLNEYDLNKKYPYKDLMGLKGDYWIRDVYIADGAVVRIIDTDPATLKASTKTYKAKSYNEMVLAIQDGLNNLYDVITVETPQLNDDLFDPFKAYDQAGDQSPYAGFSTHLSYFKDTLPTTKIVNGKTVSATKGVYKLCFAYDRPKAEIKNTYNLALAKAAEINAAIIKPSMSPYEKTQAIHDYAVTHFKYKLPVVHFQLLDQPCHNLTTLLKNEGVCDGYAWSIKLLLDQAKVENQLIYGTADNGDGNGPSGHAWNLVKLNGNYYHMDATWDDFDGKDNNYTYEYFLVDDRTIGKHHDWDIKRYPVCKDNSLEYYTKNGYVVSDSDAFYRYADKHLDRNSNLLIFRSDNFSTDWLDNRFSNLFFTSHPGWQEYWYSHTENNGLITLKLYRNE